MRKPDEKREREAFQLHWCPPDYDEAPGFHIHKQFAEGAWLARARQPVRVKREAIETAMLQQNSLDQFLHALGIEVDG